MACEVVDSTPRGVPAWGKVVNGLVAVETALVAYRHGGGINQGHARGLRPSCVERDPQGDPSTGDEFDQVLVADQGGEVWSESASNRTAVIGLDVVGVRGLKVDEQGHEVTPDQRGGSLLARREAGVRRGA